VIKVCESKLKQITHKYVIIFTLQPSSLSLLSNQIQFLEQDCAEEGPFAMLGSKVVDILKERDENEWHNE
jgi:hypothetical protein